MNPKRLLKYFPELHHLPTEQQCALLTQAHNETKDSKKKLTAWGHNIMALIALILACTIVLMLIGPLFNLEQRTTAFILLLVVFPLFIFFQQRRFIARLRKVVITNLRKVN